MSNNKIIVRQYFNEDAKLQVVSSILEHEENEFIYQWLEEDREIKCYFIEENNIIKSFALLRKCDFDPFNEHTNPYLLNYIHTFPEFRHKKYAFKLLQFIKKKTNEHITAVCNCEASEKLFTKAKFKRHNNTSLYRYP
jgi:hypothetical protein